MTCRPVSSTLSFKFITKTDGPTKALPEPWHGSKWKACEMPERSGHMCSWQFASLAELCRDMASPGLPEPQSCSFWGTSPQHDSDTLPHEIRAGNNSHSIVNTAIVPCEAATTDGLFGLHGPFGERLGPSLYVVMRFGLAHGVATSSGNRCSACCFPSS